MNTFLQIFGSIASIGGIPLAIFLYLRSREAKFSNLKREIVKILSYQIGEGRSLSTFEIRSVIDSKIREAGIKFNNLGVSEIVEDLVSETISSPMLESERKKDILSNLKSIHQRGNILTIIDKYDLELIDFLKGIKNIVKLTPEDFEIVEGATPEIRIPETISKVKRTGKLSEFFGLIAGVLSLSGILTYLLFEPTSTNSISQFIKLNQQWFEIVLGISATLVASIITFLMSYISRRKTRKDKIEK